MDLEVLQTFLAIAETGTFRAAAERRHRTQPALSRQMRLLAEDVGVALFERAGRTVRLTAAGRILAREGAALLRQVEEAVRKVQEAGGAARLSLTLGTSHHVALHRLPKPLRAFHRRFPDVRLRVIYGGSEEIIERIMAGEVDLGVVTLPAKSTRLVLTPLWTDRLVLALPPGHPLTRLKSVPLARLGSEPMLLPEAGTTTRAVIEAAFRKARVPLNPAQEIPYLDTIRVSVEMGLGLAILPETAVVEAEKRGTLATRPLAGGTITRTLGIVRRKGAVPSQGEQSLALILSVH